MNSVRITDDSSNTHTDISKPVLDNSTWWIGSIAFGDTVEKLTAGNRRQ